MNDKSNHQTPKPTLKEGGEFSVYPSIKSGLEDILKDKAKTTLYPIANFYKASLVARALNDVQVVNAVEYRTAQGKNQEIDSRGVQQSLAGNIEKLQAFYDKHKTKPLAVTTYKSITDEALPKLQKHFTLKTLQPDQWIPKTATVLEDINGASKVIRGVYVDQEPDLKNAYTNPLTGYLIIDKNRLEKALANLQSTDYQEHKTAEIVASQQGNTIEELKSFFTDLINLSNSCGIADDNGQVMSIGDIVIKQIHLEVLGFISETLAGVLKRNPPTSDKANRSVVNIKEPENHRFIGKPSTASFIDMVEGAVSGREFEKLKRTYRNEDERKADGGFLAHIENPQVALPFLNDTDNMEKAKFMANAVALAVDAVTALQAYKRDYPDREGFIRLKDLAKYIKRYADDMQSKGSLRPQYRKAILNGLTIAQLMGADYIVEKNKKTGVTRWNKVYLLNRITEYETNKKGDAIAIKTDFTPEYKASLTYNLGVVLDGVQNLSTPESKLLATYISERQVAKQDDTIAGNSITFTADTLCKKAGLINQTNPTVRYATLTKMLNDLEKEGIAVGDWNTKAKYKNITLYNKDSQTIYITPTSNVQQAYVTREQSMAEREGIKTEQKARLGALKRYANGYLDRSVLAEELEIDRQELDKLLAGQKPITDRVLEKIEIDL